jgi:hypothetical protein
MSTHTHKTNKTPQPNIITGYINLCGSMVGDCVSLWTNSLAKCIFFVFSEGSKTKIIFYLVLLFICCPQQKEGQEKKKKVKKKKEEGQEKKKKDKKKEERGAAARGRSSHASRT